MRTYGFTGASRLPVGATLRMGEKLSELTDGRCFVTGSQIGADEFIAGFLLGAFPDAAHVQIVPGYPATHGRLYPEARWVQMRGERTAAVAYRRRNEEIVRLADVLIAFPEGPEDALPRSGTWMTVRIARKAGKPVEIHELGGA